MRDEVTIDAWWDDVAKVWIATSADIAGLVVETESWGAMISEVPIVVDDLLGVRGETTRPRRFTFRAEQHLDLAAA